ncbi:hypothetical protein EDD16DRAFT_1475638, partial [Pisolithus croceorrhizus]
ATFSVNNESVYDESYRKVGKMNFADFATSFDIKDSGQTDVVRQELLEGVDDDREIKMDCISSMSYGKDSFFKAHKDTPRDQTMFSSPVFVFPSPHEGGEFVLRENEHEWAVDFAKSISESSQQLCVSYVSSYSDVEHEVRMVTFGL